MIYYRLLVHGLFWRKKIKLSILIPCLNESNYIAQCLDSLLANDYSHDNYEILIIDGGSSDDTLEILGTYTEKYSFIRVIDNPNRLKPIGLNIGIKESIGDVIMRIDAHAVYDKNYISALVNNLYSECVDNIGGIRDTYIPPNEGAMEISLSEAISHPLVVGGSYYRTGVLTKKKLVDTVFCGCYRRDVFLKVGLFNESLIRTQDREFNIRLRESGGKIMLIPDVHCTYYSRTKLFEYLSWNWNGAKWLGYARRFTTFKMLSIRNYIPVFFSIYILLLMILFTLNCAVKNSCDTQILVMVIPLLAYWILLFKASIKLFLKYKRVGIIITFPFVVFLTHLSYGIAVVYGRILSFLR